MFADNDFVLDSWFQKVGIRTVCFREI